MKVSMSKAMRKMLLRGLKKAKRRKPPSDGYSENLIYETKHNGWHYQVEFIRDSRILRKQTFVAVYAWCPPLDFTARDADFKLEQVV